MHDHPPGLVRLGYLTKSKVQSLRATGLRVWIGPFPDLAMNSLTPDALYMSFVEPWVLDVQALFWKFRKEGRTFAGLAEWEFILSATPEKNSL